jgi:hypothetical protein
VTVCPQGSSSIGGERSEPTFFSQVSRQEDLPIAGLVDNDVSVSCTRANSFGASVTGSVTLESGDTSQLAAEIRFVATPDGALELVTSQVVLGR